MARSPEEWARLLGSTLSKMQAYKDRSMVSALSPDCQRVIAQTIACVMAEAPARKALAGAEETHQTAL